MRSRVASVLAVPCAAALAAGCGSHTVSRELSSLPSGRPSAQAPPVIVAAPAPRPRPAPAPAPAPARAAKPHTPARPAGRGRQSSRPARVSSPAARYSAPLARRHRSEEAAAQPAPRHPGHAHAPPPVGRDVAEDQRQSRVNVVRFHELLGAHDPSACDLATPRFLQSHFGGEDACRSTVAGMTVPVTVYVEGSGTEPTGIWVKVLTRFGDQEKPQVFHLVLVRRAWLIDAAQPVPAS